MKLALRPTVGTLLALLTAASAATDRPRYCGTARWEPLIAEAADRFTIPRTWVREVMRAESAGCAEIDGRPVVSPAGAIGLMQVMPATYAELRARHALGPDPHVPHDNVLAGAAYLRELHDRFGAPGFLAAYHAGPARYETHRSRGDPLPQETQRYLARVHAALDFEPPSNTAPVTLARTGVPPIDRLFAIDRRSVAAPATVVTPTFDGALFVPIGRRDIANERDDRASPEPPRADP